ncbi:MAG TPA: hypothetical protein VH157_07940 [Bryobacteraceae bacterium]|jgi:hypothetical protein|nr:hypothetical protein [Bryobacteraceae bacterium]
MSHAWLVLFALGAYHGLNPAMGWLFAVSLGLQEKSGRAVWRALPPLALGHLASMSAVVAVFALLQIGLPHTVVRIAAAVVLLTLGITKLVSSRHPRWASWSGMRVGFRDLTIWSFLMATAHGAGLMLLPVLFSLPAGEHSQHMHAGAAMPQPWLMAVAVHTLAYLATAAAIALIVYRYVGLAFLRRAWLNLDVLWGMALVIAGGVTMLF